MLIPTSPSAYTLGTAIGFGLSSPKYFVGVQPQNDNSSFLPSPRYHFPLSFLTG